MRQLLQACLMAVVLVCAAAGATQTSDPQAFYNEAQTRLKSEEYSDTTTRRYWQKKNPSTPSQSQIDWSKYEWLGKLADVLERLGHSIGVFGKVVLVLLLIAFFVWLYRYKDSIVQILSKPRPPKSAKITPNFIPTSDMDNLPEHDKIAQLANKLISQGDYVGALSLLYRGSLRVMSVRHHLVIGRGRTEEECHWLLSLAKTAKPNEKQFFEMLVPLWQKSAYGSNATQSGVGHKDVTALLNAWQSVWGRV